MDAPGKSPSARARWRALSGPEHLSLVLSVLLALGFPAGAAAEGWFGVGAVLAGLLFAGLTVWRWMSWTRTNSAALSSDDQVP